MVEKGSIQGHFVSKRVILGQIGSFSVQKGHFGFFPVKKGNFRSKIPFKVISVSGRKKNLAEKFFRFKIFLCGKCFLENISWAGIQLYINRD